MTYAFHSDPGHGWVAVPYLELIRLNIHKKISKFSYRMDDECYLEKDRDMTLWASEYEQHYGRMPEITHTHWDDDCYIRKLQSYVAE